MRIGQLTVNWDGKRSELLFRDEKRGQRLLFTQDPALFRPVIDGAPVKMELMDVDESPNHIVFHFKSPYLREMELRLQAFDGYVEISSQFTTMAACELNQLELFPAGTALNMYDLVNFRNRHYTCQTWPELILGGQGCETDTTSRDWQFAPHPTMFVLRKDTAHLLFGALDIPTAFGMHFKAADYRVQQWYLDFGPTGFGLKLNKDETFASPRFCLFLAHDQSEHATITQWTDLLIARKMIPDPATKRRIPWHLESLYCTWIDQTFRSEAVVSADLNEQATGAATAITAMDESLVRDTLAVIKREQLPFRTFLLDDGWQLTRGQWEPHPHRFPNLRKLVDEIHAAGMKVVVWWAWPEINDDAEVDPAFLIGGGTRNRHGRRMWDYSNPKTQSDYLEPLFHRFFSSDPGCYDLDGIKTDFMADKVHADMPVRNPEWRGEENYFLQFYRCIDFLMRRHKPDACHHGYAGHPYLAEFIDVNRTADVASSDVREHLNRALMLEATAPGCPVAYDFHSYLENLEEWFASAAQFGAAAQISNILAIRDDRFSQPRPADARYYDLLRRRLREQNIRVSPSSAKGT